MNFLELMDYTVKNGGATLEVLKNDSYKMVEKNSGYIVGLGSEKQFNLKTDFDKIIKYFMNKNDNVIMGLWIDNGILYVDEELYFTEDLEKALRMGRLYNQKAIYSCAESKSIYL